MAAGPTCEERIIMRNVNKNLFGFGAVIVSALLAIAGCANPINRVTYKRYYQWGMAAEQNQDYEKAKENYYRALVNARIGNLGPQDNASAAYSLGRMLGILCDHDNAEKMLLEGLQFDEQSHGPVHMSFIELARLKFDQGKYGESVAYFKKALPLVDKKEYIDADPIGFAVIYGEYSDALSKTGRQADAEKLAVKAEQLRMDYPDRKAVAERTPYKENCGKNT